MIWLQEHKMLQERLNLGLSLLWDPTEALVTQAKSTKAKSSFCLLTRPFHIYWQKPSIKASTVFNVVFLHVNSLRWKWKCCKRKYGHVFEFILFCTSFMCFKITLPDPVDHIIHVWVQTHNDFLVLRRTEKWKSLQAVSIQRASWKKGKRGTNKTSS